MRVYLTIHSDFEFKGESLAIEVKQSYTLLPTIFHAVSSPFNLDKGTFCIPSYTSSQKSYNKNLPLQIAFLSSFRYDFD